MDVRPVLYIVGILLSTLSLGMVFPMMIDLYDNNADWKVFFACIIATSFFGGTLVLSNSKDNIVINTKQGFLMITMSWVSLCVFSALPFWLSASNVSFVDAIFESTSGLTTTGSTIFTNLESLPRGLLIWRSVLQWLGGIGVIIMAMSVLPMLKVGGMQLFETELSEKEKAMPRTAKLASSIGVVYLILTIICALSYHATGMGVFDSLAHAMTTIATGGYSTYDTSFSHYHTYWPEIVAVIFMIAGGIPFVLYLKAIGGNPKAALKDTQVRWFLTIIALTTLLLTGYMWGVKHMDLDGAFVKTLFNVTSLMTGTGFTSENYGAWGIFPIIIFFFLMSVGACAGSTSCGIKIFRFQILYSVANMQMKKLLHPHGVFIPYYNNKAIPLDVQTSVMSFFFVFALCFTIIAVALSMVGLDYMTAMSGAVTSLSNVGPGLGPIIGPAGTFAPLPDAAKWILCFAMILGRLELFTVLVLLSPHFWRR